MFPSFIRRKNASITAAVKKSNITMTFLLLTLSATMPPTGDNIIDGIKAHAITVPYSADDPVRFSRYKGSANLNVAFPNSEMICPITTNVKSFEKSF